MQGDARVLDDGSTLRGLCEDGWSGPSGTSASKEPTRGWEERRRRPDTSR